MKLTKLFIAAGILAAMVGCEKGVENAPGPEAKANKEYSKEDALSIKPTRKGND
jgi:hypothetical protein